MPNIQILRIGRISSINYLKGTARVTYEDRAGATTGELPFIAWEYWMPRVEDLVLVGHLSNGTTAAVIIGPVWHNGHRPAEGGSNLYRKEYALQMGQAYERYDSEAKEYSKIITGKGTLEIGGCTITIENGKIHVDAPGGVTVSGDVVAGNVSLQNHSHHSE